MFLTRWQKPTLATAWPTYDRLFSLRDELDRLFESPLNDLARTTNLLSGWSPAVDLYEDKENFIVQPFIELLQREGYEGTQMIITGASFADLEGATRRHLTHVHIST